MEKLAKRLADDMTVKELRLWMKEHGISRTRGASKMMSARRAVDQNRKAVEDYFGLNDPYHVGCMCGFEEKVDEKSDALEIAQKHSVKSTDCNAKVWAPKGQQIYGRLGTREFEV